MTTPPLPYRKLRHHLVIAFAAACALVATGLADAGKPDVSVSISSPGNGAQLSGTVVWEASATGAVRTVTFSVDGGDRTTERQAPYTYALDTTTLSDGGHTLSVTASGRGNSTATASIAVTVANKVPAPVEVTAPSVSGTAVVGQQLTASAGTWSNAPSSYAYAWQRCASGGSSCSDVSGAGGAAYGVTDADAGYALRVVVTASNSGGFGSAASDATSVVPAATTSTTSSTTTSTTTTSTTTTSSGSFTTSLVDGSTITEPYTWTFDPGVPTTAGYFWADGVLLEKITGPGPYSLTLDSLSAGVHLLGHGWDLSDGTHVTPSSSYSVTVVGPTTTATTTTSSGGPTWPDTSEPAYTPNRVASTPAEFSSIMSSLHAGDVVEVKPMTLTGEIVFSQRLSSPAEIHFDSGVKFTGAPAGSRLPAVWITGENLHMYGGDVVSPGFDCVKVSSASSAPGGPTNIRWWGAKLHDCAAQGLSVQGNTYPNSGLDFAVEVWDIGQDLSLDPHVEKGTGLHGAYLGGASTPTTNSRFLLNVHDLPVGSAVQIGPRLQNSTVWVKASHITMAGISQSAGYALSMFGADNSGVHVMDLEADDLAGNAVVVSSLTGGTDLVVEHARATNVALSPAYQSSSYYSCVDCK